MPPLRLEVFETGPATQAGTVVTDAEAMEEARLAAYEQGYGAGWEDACAAQATETARLQAELAHNLQSLGFTYHEARVHVLRALESLLAEIVARLLPEIARETLIPFVIETLLPMAEAAAEAPVRLIFNPVARAAIEVALEQVAGLPIELCEEPTLGEGQAYLRLGEAETEVDLDRAIDDIATAVHAFFDSQAKDALYG